MKFIHKLALGVLAILLVVLGIMLLIGVVLGDDTPTETDDPSGGTSMPSIARH